MRGRGVAQGRGASFAKKSTASRLGRWLKLPTKTRPARSSKGVVVIDAGSCAFDGGTAAKSQGLTIITYHPAC